MPDSMTSIISLLFKQRKATASFVIYIINSALSELFDCCSECKSKYTEKSKHNLNLGKFYFCCQCLKETITAYHVELALYKIKNNMGV